MITRVIHILLVDDDTLDQEDVRRALDRRNILHRLTIARNGIEALDYLERTTHRPDIILLDLNMPRMSGFEMLATLKSRDEWKDIKVFIVTVSNDVADKRAAADLGISGFITKPLKLESPASADVFNLMMDIMNIH